ncbi:1-aminocyclopropane-1-carboxylate synthase-like protein 1 [Ptychodera flava]|uniref:1-aminocyclopropane-1-carboxylate synthase-like protein 1 n=1 Tax=Ptychodera flava TaxID=63121 RepID=UPI00396A5001
MAMENTSEVSDILSERCRQRFLNKPQPEIDRASDCERRPYDRETNPKGFIRLSLSENHLCDDIIKVKLEDPKHHVIESWMLQYCDNRGTLKLRQAVADYLTMKTKSSKPVSAEHISILNGAESVITTLTYIICDPGDGFLIPAPCYGGINVGLTADMTRVGEVKPVYAYLQSQVNFDAGEKRPFQLTVDRLETALRKARDEGINVRGLFLINPHNPLGDIYPAEVIMDCLHFAHRNSLHVVIDEIYMGTIFKPDNSFTSVLNLHDLPDPQRTHLIWGFSKDFGLAGFRCGVLHSKNSKLHEAVDYLAYFNVVSSHTQNLLAEFISDHEWINNVFFPTNHQRLRESHQCISDGLTKLGIPHLHRSAGLFIWADFRLYLPQPSFEEELSLEHRFERLVLESVLGADLTVVNRDGSGLSLLIQLMS